MSRLTKKETNNLSCHHFKRCEYLRNGTPRIETLNKLGKLEDLEEELGCPLDVVFRAIEKGVEYIVKITSVYVGEPKTEETRIEHRESFKAIKLVKDVFRGNQYVFIVGYEPSKYGLKEDIVYLKDYQKAWWIKGERNKKENEIIEANFIQFLYKNYLKREDVNE